jgi:hypothetical protein
MLIYCHVLWSDCRWGFGLDIGFVDHLYIRLGTTSNYIIELHTSNIFVPATHITTCLYSLTFNWLLTVTDFFLQTPIKNWLSCLSCLPCTDRVENTVSNSTSVVACVSVAAGTYLLSRCLEMNVVSESFARNSCFSGSTGLALSKYATV